MTTHILDPYHISKTMWLVILWLVGIPKLLYNFILTFVLLILFVCYKIFGHQRTSASRHLQEQFERQHKYIVASSGELKDKIKLALMRGARVMSSRQSQEPSGGSAGVNSRQTNHTNSTNNNLPNHNNNNQSNANGRFYLASLAALCLLLAVGACHLPLGAHGLEQDAEILKPVANIAKAVIKTVSLGVPLEMHFDPTGLAKNFAYFTWRTGFPVTMPSGFVQKAQEFYNRVKARVDVAEVSDVERKSLVSLKTDLDDIVDGIVEEVRKSPQGLYTDYLQTQVNGMPLEDVCVAVGTQLKAYGVDLTNYRNIAGMVLGIPVMPTVASAVMNVRNLASLDTMRNLTNALHPMSLARLPGSALSSIDNMRHAMPLQNMVPGPLQNMVQAPFLFLSSGQRLLNPLQEQEPQPQPQPQQPALVQPVAV